MTPAKFASLVRYYTKTNSTTFSDADLLILANAFKDDFAAEIAKTNEDYFVLEYYDDLVVNQRQYPLPDELLGHIKSVYGKLKTTDTEYKWLKEYELNSLKIPFTDSQIKAYMAGRDAGFELMDRSIWLLHENAVEAVTDGLKVLCVIYPADFTDLTSTIDMAVNPSDTTHGFPRQFHELLARRVSMAWKSNRPKPVKLSKDEEKFDIDFQLKINSIKGQNLDRAVVATVPSNDGSDY